MTRKQRAQARNEGARGARPGHKTARPLLPPDRVVLILAAIGLVITGYLTGVAWWADRPAFCVAGGGCDLVQQSRWSSVFGIPVALFGFLTYALLALLAWRGTSKIKRWQRLWIVSLIGVAISVYLTIAAAVVLQAACGWCLASLATLLAIFVVLNVQRPDGAPGTPWPQWLLAQGLVAGGVLLVLHLYWSGLFELREQPKLQALATHLSDSGAKFYGASWCGNCNTQKDLFGSSAKRLPYIECSPAGRNGPVAGVCLDAGVGTYPTWIIKGKPYEGVMQIDELAKRSGFRWKD